MQAYFLTVYPDTNPLSLKPHKVKKSNAVELTDERAPKSNLLTTVQTVIKTRRWCDLVVKTPNSG